MIAKQNIQNSIPNLSLLKPQENPYMLARQHKMIPTYNINSHSLGKTL